MSNKSLHVILIFTWHILDFVMKQGVDKIKTFANKTKDMVLMQAQFAKEQFNKDEYERDPIIEDAKEKLESLERMAYHFEMDLKELSTIFPKVADSSMEFTTHFRNSDRKLGRKEDPTVLALDDFARTISQQCKSQQLEIYKQNVEKVFKEINEAIKELNNMRKQRHDTRLLAASLKSRVESHSKKGDPKEAAELRIRYEKTQGEFNKLNKNFIRCVNNFWNNRHIIFEPAMQELAKLTYNVCHSLYPPMQVMIKDIPKEVLTKDYHAKQHEVSVPVTPDDPKMNDSNPKM